MTLPYLEQIFDASLDPPIFVANFKYYENKDIFVEVSGNGIFEPFYDYTLSGSTGNTTIVTLEAPKPGYQLKIKRVSTPIQRELLAVSNQAQLQAIVGVSGAVPLYRGIWTSGTAYNVNNISNIDDLWRLCITSHTSGGSPNHFEGSNWTTILDFNSTVATIDAAVIAATTKAAEANTSASSASTSASTATTQAGIATTQASNASSSASTATTQAGIATTQASNASASASAASSFASSASTSASTATTQAGIATTKAAEAAASAAAAATFDPSSYYSKIVSDGKFMKIKTSPTALANNATISTTNDGIFYSMNLSASVQVANLPSTSGLADGWSCVIQATGTPSGYQTSYISGNTKNISFRNSTYSNFHLIGQGEIFRFSWLSGLNYWLAECLSHPNQIKMNRGNTATTWSLGSTSFVALRFFTLGGTSSPFNTSNIEYTLAPIAGIFEVKHRMYISSAAGGGVSGSGYLIGGVLTSFSGTSQQGYNGRWYNVTNSDASYLEVSSTDFMVPGNYFSAFYTMSTSGLWFYPGNNEQNITLLSR